MDRTLAPRQLVLALGHAESFAREDFLAGPSNAAALALIERWPDWPAPAMALVGPEGSGKSHLASIWAEASGARVLAARLLGEVDLPAALATGALVLEDLDPAGLDERALFHLINLAREQGASLLFTARQPPAGFQVAHPRSRLAPARHAGGDAGAARRRAAARADRQARRRPPARGGRGAGQLSRQPSSSAPSPPRATAVKRLDQEAMRLHRPVTRALAAELFR